MDNLKHLRIDERLVHGQVVTVWLQKTGSDTILVADDQAANDSLSKTLFKMAVPSGVKLEVLNLEKSVEYMKNVENESVLLITRSLETTLRLIDLGLEFTDINIGNISQASGKKKYTKAVWLNSEDIELIEKIKTLGKRMYVQVVPNERAYDIDDILS